MLKDVMKLYIQLHGPVSQSLAMTYYNTGVVWYNELKNYEEAHKAYRQAYMMYVEVLGKEHQTTQTVLNALLDPRFKSYRDEDDLFKEGKNKLYILNLLKFNYCFTQFCYCFSFRQWR